MTSAEGLGLERMTAYDSHTLCHRAGKPLGQLATIQRHVMTTYKGNNGTIPFASFGLEPRAMSSRSSAISEAVLWNHGV